MNDMERARSAGTGTHTREELLSSYESFEREAARKIPGCDRDSNCREIVDVLDSLAVDGYRSDELDGIRRLQEELKEHGSQIASLKNGMRGESIVKRALNDLGMPHRNLRNVRIALGNDEHEYDFIVITEHCVVFIEAKWRNDDSVIDSTGHLKGKRSFDIADNMLSKQNLLSQVLGNEVSVQGILAFANQGAIVEDNWRHIDLLYPRQLSARIESMDNEMPADTVFDPCAIESIIKDHQIERGYQAYDGYNKTIDDLDSLFPDVDSVRDTCPKVATDVICDMQSRGRASDSFAAPSTVRADEAVVSDSSDWHPVLSHAVAIAAGVAIGLFARPAIAALRAL